MFFMINYGSGDGIIEVSGDNGSTWTQLLTLTIILQFGKLFLSLDTS